MKETNKKRNLISIISIISVIILAIIFVIIFCFTNNNNKSSTQQSKNISKTYSHTEPTTSIDEWHIRKAKKTADVFCSRVIVVYSEVTAVKYTGRYWGSNDYVCLEYNFTINGKIEPKTVYVTQNKNNRAWQAHTDEYRFD